MASPRVSYLGFSLFLGLLSLSGTGLAQDASAPGDTLLERFRKQYQTEAFRLGVLQQVGANFGAKGPDIKDGFDAGTTQLRLSGRIEEGLVYRIMFQLQLTPPLKDAVIVWQPRPGLRFAMGQFKSPFSQEALQSDSGTDLINRSQVVTLLAPGRQVGFEVRLHDADDKNYAAVGLFNGNGSNKTNDDDELTLVGRVRTRLLRWSTEDIPVLRTGFKGFDWLQDRLLHSGDVSGRAEHALDLGASVLVGDEDAPKLSAFALPGTTPASIPGRRMTIGLEASLSQGRFGGSAEWLRSEFETDLGMDLRAEGYYLTGWYWIDRATRLIYRYDQYERKLASEPDGFHILATSRSLSETFSVTALYCKGAEDTVIGENYADNLFQVLFTLEF